MILDIFGLELLQLVVQGGILVERLRIGRCELHDLTMHDVNLCYYTSM